MTYLLRDIDPDLWARVKTRAARDRHSVKDVILRLLRAYVGGRI
jgi:plasmid stability protein